MSEFRHASDFQACVSGGVKLGNNNVQIPYFRARGRSLLKYSLQSPTGGLSEVLSKGRDAVRHHPVPQV